MMWGVVVGGLLMGTGVVLVAVGSGSLNAAETRRSAVLEDAFISSASSPQSIKRFEEGESFAAAMDEPSYTSFYLWNITNGGAFVSGTEPPTVAQMGPYTYMKTARKVNVAFEAPSGKGDYSHVSYATESYYTFVPERSNGSESDLVMAMNGTYARTLAKYREFGYSERLLVAEYARQHLQSYRKHLHGKFIADTKQRALQFFLPYAIDRVREESIGAAIHRQQQRVDAASIPGNLVQIMAAARTEMIPQVLEDLMRDVSDKYIPEILQAQFEIAKDHAMPRVLSNLLARLKVEAVPVLLQKQLQVQHQRHVPYTLSSLDAKLSRVVFPYVLQEVYERACVEAVPSILRTIKLEIIARDIATNLVQADVAQNNVIETWRKRTTSARVDFDAWIDENPTGQARTGFELRPATAALELSKEVATLLIGSKSSNKRFSIVDYDTQATAAYPLDEATDTPTGFGIWKQVIAMNETAIAYLIENVNNDVARSADYITRDQVLYVRQYLMQWAQRDVVQRDRERFWIQNYVKRTANSDSNEPPVDLDVELVGVQTGFNLQAGSSVTAAIARHVWNASDLASFIHVQGFTTWYDAVVLASATAKQTLMTSITGLTNNQFDEIGTWLTTVLNDGFVRRRALRHWSDGTCKDAFKLPRASCLVYDLEPFIAGVQGGFEMNPASDGAKSVAQGVREELWDVSKQTSFLLAVHAADTATGYGLWLKAILTDSSTAVVDALKGTYPSFSTAQATAIMSWLQAWCSNDLHALNIRNWWRSATCWPRETITEGTRTTVTTNGLSSCEETYAETEVSATVTVTGAPQSPFSTTERVLNVAMDECDWDPAASKYTKRAITYQTTVREWSCDAFSTELSSDHAVADWKTGFEVGPLVSVADAALRPSLATATVLWDSSNAASFLHPTGYKKWVFDWSKDKASVSAALMTGINAQISATCSAKITGGGAHSAVFNVTLIGTDASCGQATLAQIDLIQAWIASQSQLQWVESALLDQWRRGDFAEAMDIEPYRASKQAGLELSTGCGCSLTTEKGTKYSVPRDALTLWNISASSASFLSTQGYATWSALRNASDANDAVEIDEWKQTILTASGLSTWEPWLDSVASWLSAWRSNEHLLRDVLGHWLHGTCSTSPSPLSTVSGPTTVSTAATACPPAEERYTVSLNDTLDDLLAAASRPAFGDYFDSMVVENAAKFKPTKVLEATETWIECDFIAANQYTLKTTTLVSIKEYSACNFLSVIANGSTESVPIAQEEVTFEMNRTASDPTFVSMEVALAAWDQEEASAWTFINSTVFLSKWQPAIHRNSIKTALQTEMNAAVASSQGPSTLSAITDYLLRWETSSKSTRRVAEAWLVMASPFLDFDLATAGIQGGFELMTSTAWRKIAGISAAEQPSLDQAQYLWDAQSLYSFLNRDAKLTNGLPVGFAAWREVYNGTDYSSERLVTQYPPVATVERDNRAVKTLSEADRKSLLTLMTSATQLTEKQLVGISFWLMEWAENRHLYDYLHTLWSTGMTPRGEEGVAMDLARYTTKRFDLQGLDYQLAAMKELQITEGAALMATVSKATLRKLWDVKTPASLVNPLTRSVWCCINLPALGVCPDVVDELGAINGSTYDAFVSIVQPVVEDRGTITRASNLTAMALVFFDRQFGLNSAQVYAIASWWRAVPSTSMLFRAIQAQQWQSPAGRSVDPLWLGYGLADVFPVGEEPVKRRANGSDLVENPVGLISTCNVSTSLVLALWNESSTASFVNAAGLERWLSHLRSESPRDSKAMATVLAGEDEVMASVAATETEAAIVCTVDAVSNWIQSWEYHPTTRQFVEALWYHDPSNRASPVSILQDPSALMQAFPVSSADVASENLRLQARIAEVVLNPSEPIALNNVAHGFPVWRAILGNCSATKPSTYACALPESKKEVASLATASAAALKQLATAISDRIIELESAQGVAPSQIQKALEATVVPWLMHLLDHSLLFEYIVKHAIPSTTGIVASSYADLPAIQFANGSITNASFSLPRFIDTMDGYAEQLAVATERVASTVRLFNAKTPSDITPINTTGSFGFGEVTAFCNWGHHDRIFAYDSTASCALTATRSYVINAATATAVFEVFGDAETVAVAQGGDGDRELTVARASLLIDAFLAQPFVALDDCERLVDRIAQAYSLSASQKQHACKTVSANRILLGLPQLTAMGFTVSAVDWMQDFQAYLKYAATKFVYEPLVVGLPHRPLLSSELGGAVTPLDSWTAYPVGGYVAMQTVSQLLQASKITGFSLSHREEPTVSPLITYLIPTQQDTSLVSKHTSNTVGELVAIDGSTSLTVLGTSATLKPFHATDGSQFMTAVLAARRIGTAFPPPLLFFYWEAAQRLLQLTYEKNVTRFGVPLMRYAVLDWREPSTFSAGLDAAARSDSATPANSVNASTLVDGLSMVLSAAPATPINSQEPSRETAFDIDPVTGQVFHRRLTWQLSAKIHSPDPARDLWHKSITSSWLPALWIREQRSVSPPQAATFLSTMIKSGPFAPEKLAMWGVVGGAAYIAVGAAMSYVYLKRARVVRLHKMQSVMPVASLAAPVTVKSVDGLLSHEAAKNSAKAVSHHVDQTSDVDASSSTSPRARKRTTPRIQSIEEAQEEGGSDIQQA